MQSHFSASENCLQQKHIIRILNTNKYVYVHLKVLHSLNICHTIRTSLGANYV